MSREMSRELLPKLRERYERREREGRARMLDEVCEPIRIQPQARELNCGGGSCLPAVAGPNPARRGSMERRWRE